MIFSGSFSTMTYWQEGDVFHEGAALLIYTKIRNLLKELIKGEL